MSIPTAHSVNKKPTNKRTQWLAENKEKLEYCNKMIAEHGLFSDDYRVF